MKKLHILLSVIAVSILLQTNAQTPQFEWAQQIEFPCYGKVIAIGADNAHNVYTMFDIACLLSIDFDPGSGVFNITPNTNGNTVFIQKLDANRNFLWAKALYSSDGGAYHHSVVDGNGNIYMTGGFVGTVDFDPGAGVANLTAASQVDNFIAKYDSNGNLLWVKHGDYLSDSGIYCWKLALARNGDIVLVGDFDGMTFKADPKNQKWLDYGKDNYALVTWSNPPDDRILALGWMSNWQYAQKVPTQRWRSAMTLPRELKLYKQGLEFVLRSMPVKELASLEADVIAMETKIIKDSSLKSDINPASKLEFSFKKPSSGLLTIRFSNAKNEYLDVGYDADSKTYFVDRTASGKSDFSSDFAGRHTGQAPYNHDTVEMLIYMDHASVELFADSGQCVMTEIFFPSEPFSKVQILGKEIELIKGNFTSLDVRKVK